MITIIGRLQEEHGSTFDFSRRVREHKSIFERAVGESLSPGTLNVVVNAPIQIREHFRISGVQINESEDFLFEVCRVNGRIGFRVRPLHPLFHTGGRGDHVIEIMCSVNLQSQPAFNAGCIELSFFR